MGCRSKRRKRIAFDRIESIVLIKLRESEENGGGQGCRKNIIDMVI